MWYFNTLEEKNKRIKFKASLGYTARSRPAGFSKQELSQRGERKGVEVSDVVNPTSHKGFGSFPSPLISFVEVLTITGASWPPDDSHRFFMCVFVCTHPLCVLWGVSMNTRRGLWVFWS